MHRCTADNSFEVSELCACLYNCMICVYYMYYIIMMYIKYSHIIVHQCFSFHSGVYRVRYSANNKRESCGYHYRGHSSQGSDAWRQNLKKKTWNGREEGRLNKLFDFDPEMVAIWTNTIHTTSARCPIENTTVFLSAYTHTVPIVVGRYIISNVVQL